MSTSSRTSPIEGCRPTDSTPVSVDADAIAGASREDLRGLADDLAESGYVPAEVAVDVAFDEDCSLATQREADRLRELVENASFLGANRLTVDVREAASPEKVRPALSAVAERARRDGLAVDVRGLALN